MAQTSVSTFFKVREVFLSAHVCSSHVVLDDSQANQLVGGDYNRSGTSSSYIHPVVTPLVVKYEAGLQKDAFKGLPWNRSYAW